MSGSLIPAAAGIRTQVQFAAEVVGERGGVAVHPGDAVAVLVLGAQDAQPELLRPLPVVPQNVAELRERQLPAVEDELLHRHQRVDRGAESGAEKRGDVVDAPVGEGVLRRLQTVGDRDRIELRRIDVLQVFFELVRADVRGFDDVVEVLHVGGVKLPERMDVRQFRRAAVAEVPGLGVDSVVEHQFDRLEHVDMPGAGDVAERARRGFVTAADVAGAGKLLRIPLPHHHAADALLADEHQTVMAAPDHIQRLVQEFDRGVAGKLDLNLRRRNRKLVEHIENEIGEHVDFTAAVRPGSAEVEGVPPVVVDRRPLHQEAGEELPDLRLGEASFAQVAFVVRPEHAVEVAERTHLQPVDVFAEHEVQIDDLERFVDVARRAGAELLQTFDLRLDAGIAGVMAPGVVDEAAEALQHGVDRDLQPVEIGGRRGVEGAVLLPFGPVTAGTVAQSGEAEREDRVPVGHRMVEVDPHQMESRRVAFLHQAVALREETLLRFMRPAEVQRRKRPVVTVVTAEAGEPVVRIHVDQHIPADMFETAPFHHRVRQIFELLRHRTDLFLQNGVLHTGGAVEDRMTEFLRQIGSVLFKCGIRHRTPPV